jgi:hypothetical protein
MANLIKVQRPTPQFDVDAFILSRWLMFLRAPRQTAPGAPVDLGEIGAAPEKTWTRVTPYSLAKPMGRP